MAQVHIRIVAALIALSVLAVTVLGAAYLYREAMQPEKVRKAEVKKILEQKGPKADPGKKIHDQAMDLIRRRELDAAREKLTEIIEVYKDSERYSSARAVLGEMNLDRLFDRKPMPGKLEYTIASRDSLNALAAKFRTTIGYIKRVNNLLGPVIHPGDRLVIYPLDFQMDVDLENKRLTVTKDGRYFKDYTVLSYHLPAARISSETTLGEIYGWLDGKKVRADHTNFTLAPKRLQTAGRKGGSGGVVFCTEPPKPAPGAAPAVSGVFLAREDLEELSTLLRPGITVRFLKSVKS